MAIDPDLKALFNGTLRVRRATPSRSGSSETLSDEVELPAFVEPRTEYRHGQQPDRVTVHFVIVDHADVVDIGLAVLDEELRDVDRFWINDQDSSDGKGKKGRIEGPFTNPEDPTEKTHWEVTL